MSTTATRPVSEARLKAAIETKLNELGMPGLTTSLSDAVHSCFVGVRLTRNGVTEPGPGKCREVWDALDAVPDGDATTLQGVLSMADQHGWNLNNARIEFYRWRQFHGI